jgi:hypothetical protein
VLVFGQSKEKICPVLAGVQLNGHELTVAADDKLPAIEGERIPAGQIGLAPASLVVADAGNRGCQ